VGRVLSSGDGGERGVEGGEAQGIKSRGHSCLAGCYGGAFGGGCV